MTKVDVCSDCGYEASRAEALPFCPHCRSAMRRDVPSTRGIHAASSHIEEPSLRDKYRRLNSEDDAYGSVTLSRRIPD
jgi:predicted amidophosphoribosyltransferase